MLTASTNQPVVQPGTVEDLVFLGVDEQQVHQYQRGPYFVGVANEKIIGAAGVVIFWPGVGEAWLIVTDDLLKHRVWFAKTTKRYLKDVMSVTNLHRLQTSVDANSFSDQRFVEFLGMHPEGVMSAYGPNGEDCIRYALVKG